MLLRTDTATFSFEVNKTSKFRTQRGLAFLLEVHHPQDISGPLSGGSNGYLKLRKLNRSNLGHQVSFRLFSPSHSERSVERELLFYRGTMILSLDIPKSSVMLLAGDALPIRGEVTARDLVYRPERLSRRSVEDSGESSRDSWSCADLEMDWSDADALSDRNGAEEDEGVFPNDLWKIFNPEKPNLLRFAFEDEKENVPTTDQNWAL